MNLKMTGEKNDNSILLNLPNIQRKHICTFRSPWILLNSIFQFPAYKSYVCSDRFVPKYFIWRRRPATIKWHFKKIPLLITYDLYVEILVVYPGTVTNSTEQQNCFLKSNLQKCHKNFGQFVKRYTKLIYSNLKTSQEKFRREIVVETPIL